MLIALMAHVLFFSLVTFKMPDITPIPKTEIAFLGAILDSFEVQRLDNVRATTPDVSTILSKPNQRAGKEVMSSNKPKFADRVNVQSKNFVKSATQDAIVTDKIIPLAPQKTVEQPAETQLYQRLRLYR